MAGERIAEGWDVTEAQQRLRLVWGPDGLDKLAGSCVVVLGLGGVGSWCCEALARDGVGTLVIVDRDEVELSNVNRQAVAWRDTLGRAKVDVMAEMVAQVNPLATVVRRHQFVSADNAGELFDGLPRRPDFVVDAIDTITQKLVVARLCQDRVYRLVSSMGGGNKVDPTRLRFMDLFDTSGDPISRVMRREARRRGIESLTVLCSDEPSRTPVAPEVPTPGKPGHLGTTSYLPPVMGLMLASYVIRELVGEGVELGRASR